MIGSMQLFLEGVDAVKEENSASRYENWTGCAVHILRCKPSASMSIVMIVEVVELTKRSALFKAPVETLVVMVVISFIIVSLQA